MIQRFLLAVLTCVISMVHSSPREHAQDLCEQAKQSKEQKNIPLAVEKYRQAMQVDPTYAPSYRDVARLMYDRGDYDLARSLLQLAVHYSEGDVMLQFECANMLLGSGAIQLGYDVYTDIGNTFPHEASVQYNRAYSLKLLGRLDEAVDICRALIHQDDSHMMAHLGLAFALMMAGDYEQGWREHAWNLRNQGKDSPEIRKFAAEKSFAGKRIVLRPEGGLGDTLNFFRYAKRLKDAGATVYAWVQDPLYPLLCDVPYVDMIFTNKTKPVGLEYDAIASYMSMPALIGDLPETMSREVPYLSVTPERIEQWANRIEPTKKTYNIGICWQADVYNDSSRLPIARRGIPLALLLSLADIPGVQLYSLQKKDGVEQLASSGGKLVAFDDLDEHSGPFVDTAALIMNMDLVITIDSAVAHLAGALGKKVWLMLPYVIDWRWYMHRTDSCWYPTMHVFRQPAPFDWQSVAQSVNDGLVRVVG